MAFVYSFVLEPCFEPYCVDSSATLMIHVVPVVYSQMLHWNRVVGLAFVLNGWIKRASPWVPARWSRRRWSRRRRAHKLNARSKIVVSMAEEPGLPVLIDSPLGLGLASAAGARVTGAAARTGRLGLRRGG